MSEFDKLKNDAEQYAQRHPQQVEKAEQAAEKKLGLPGQREAQQDQPPQDPGTANQDGQNSAGQGQ